MNALITRKQLVDDLYCLRGATFVSIVARTLPAMIGGKSCPLAGLEKVAYVNGMMNWKYANAVNNQRQRENQPIDAAGNVEEFVSQPRQWGRRLHDALLQTRAGNARLLPFVAHEKGNKNTNNEAVTLEGLKKLPIDQLYLEFKFEQSIDYKYFHNGKEISKEEAHKHIRPKSESSRQEVKNEIVLRDYKLTNIEQITYGDKTYTLAD